MERVRARREETEEEESAEAEEEEEESGEAAGLLSNLIIETAGIEKEATEGLAEAQLMKGVEDE